MMPPNYFQAATSAEKLRGQYYTPPALVRLILERLAPSPDDLFVDPSCGDGEFLVGVVHHLAGTVARTGVERREIGAGLSRRLVGFDVNVEAARLARRRVSAALGAEFGVSVPVDDIPITCRSLLEQPGRESLLSHTEHVTRRLLLVGNPPYVEAKRLPAAVRAQLKLLFPSALGGAPDLYLYFLAICLTWLREQDLLALVLPNKVLVNANARGIRERLLEAGQLAGIDFATRAGLFEGAAVYPIVLYAAAPTGPGPGAVPAIRNVRLGRIERSLERSTGRSTETLCCYDLALVPAGVFRATNSRALFPLPAAPAARDALLSLVNALAPLRLGDLVEIRWTVSFHRQGLRERFVSRERPDSPFARRFLGGGTFAGNGDLTRYLCRWSGWWIDYDRERLRSEGNPLPDPLLFDRPKIAICQNGRTLRAAYDADGYVLKDTLLCAVPKAPNHALDDHPLIRHPRALVGLLCSQTIHFFYSHVFYGGHVNGGYLHFLTGFLVDIPVGDWTEEQAAQASGWVEKRERESSVSRQAFLEAEIERRVQDALGLTAEQREAISRWACEDENWLARDRVRTQAIPRSANKT